LCFFFLRVGGSNSNNNKTHTHTAALGGGGEKERCVDYLVEDGTVGLKSKSRRKIQRKT
jgi:hypothetical protein